MPRATSTSPGQRRRWILRPTAPIKRPAGPTSFRLPSSTRELQPLPSAIGGDPIAIATGPSGVIYASTTSGLMKSSDRGNSWKKLDLPPLPPLPWYIPRLVPPIAYGLAVDPSNPDIVYAAANKLGVLKSSDGGKSWETALRIEGASSVVLEPGSPSIMRRATPSSRRRTGPCSTSPSCVCDGLHRRAGGVPVRQRRSKLGQAQRSGFDPRPGRGKTRDCIRLGI